MIKEELNVTLWRPTKTPPWTLTTTQAFQELKSYPDPILPFIVNDCPKFKDAKNLNLQSLLHKQKKKLFTPTCCSVEHHENNPG